MYKGWKKLIAVCVSVSLFISTIPPVFATSSDNEPQSSIRSDDILYELDEMRDTYTKVFRLRNGNNLAYISSAPIHYQENEEWKDIDNTLQLDETTDTYTNLQNDIQISLPQQMDAQAEVSIEKDNYSVSFQLLGSPSPAVAETEPTQLQNVQVQAQAAEPSADILDFISEENLYAEMEYKEVFDDIDLTYQVQPSSLKEELVLGSRPQNQLTFSFAIHCAGLTPVLEEDNSISFYQADTDEVLFVMPTPVMFDAADDPVYSSDIDVTLVQTDNAYQLNLTPSFAWLTDNERKYPVSVDPTIMDPEAVVQDTYITQTSPDKNYNTWSSLKMGKKSYALFRPVVNGWIDDGARIENVKLCVVDLERRKIFR